MTDLRSLPGAAARATLAHSARAGTETLEGSAPFAWLVRAGFVARAVTYALIGALALAMAVGAGSLGARPDQQGALALIARSPAGGAALVVVCGGLLAYAVWKVTQGVLGRGPEGGGGSSALDRISNLAGGAVYLVFFVVALRILTGSTGNSSGAPRRAAAGVLGWPGGRFIVGATGVAMIAICLYQVYDAVHGGFARDSKSERMSHRERQVFMALGHVGLAARAIVFGLVGYFVLRTAIAFDPGSAVGLDGALSRLHHQPFGPWLLGVVAIGLLTFAAYSMVEARYRRL